MSLVQGHCKDVPIPVPTPLPAQTALPLLCASLGKLMLGTLVLHPPALLIQVFLFPGSQCLQGAPWEEVPPGPVQSVRHPTNCLEQHRF